MRNYLALEKPWSCCVRFVRRSEIDEEIEELARDLRNSSLTWCYVDGKCLLQKGIEIADAIGDSLQLENRPYGADAWVRFLDDLITASDDFSGCVVIVDNAHLLHASRPSEFYDLIESFLIQWHSWFEKKKPCHLCLQMEPDSRVSAWFGPRNT